MNSESSAATGPVSHEPANPAAFWLSLAGLAIQGISTVMIAAMYPLFQGFRGMMGYYGGMMGGYYGAYSTGWYGWMGLSLVVAVVALVLGILGVVWMNSSIIGRVRNGSVLVLIAAVVAFPTMWGFWIGSVLMFVGAVMGLATNPNRV
jgi:hypothetical protein